MKDKTTQSIASQLLEKMERGSTVAAQSSETFLLDEIRFRQKKLDPEKFSNQKVSIK